MHHGSYSVKSIYKNYRITLWHLLSKETFQKSKYNKSHRHRWRSPDKILHAVTSESHRVFPYFLLVTEVTMSKSNSSSISCHFFFFFYYQQTVWKPLQQKSNLFWRSPLGRLESQDSTINHTETCVLFTLAFAVSNIVSTIRTSEPPSKSPLACSA